MRRRIAFLSGMNQRMSPSNIFGEMACEESDESIDSTRKKDSSFVFAGITCNITCNNKKKEQEQEQDNFFSPSQSLRSNLAQTGRKARNNHNLDTLANSNLRKTHICSDIAAALELEALVTREDDEIDMQDGELLSSSIDIFRNRLSKRTKVFNFILAVSALLDFIGFLAPVLLRVPEEYEEDDSRKYLYRHFFDKVAESINVGPVHSTLSWFEAHTDMLGIAFSLLWFVHSFGRASRLRHWTLRRRDRKRLLKEESSSDLHNESMQASKTVVNDSNGQSCTSAYTMIDWTGGAWDVYAKMIIIQLLLLPVGFYSMTYNAIRAFFFGVVGIVETPEHGTKEMVKAVLQEKSILVDEVVSTKFQQSLLYVIFHQVVYFLSNHLKTKTKDEIAHQVSKLKHFLMWFAVRHPLEFKRKLQKFLRAFRWARYVAPLLSQMNKLKGHIMDLIEKCRQQREERIYRRVLKRQGKLSLSDMSDSERLEHAPILIQSTWRAHQKRKAYRAILMMRFDAELFSALRLQRFFTAWLLRARARLARKKVELAQLQEMERQVMNCEEGVHFSAVQRKRMYRLQDELKSAAKKRRQRKMLLRPNTQFAVRWKFIFVSCLLIELSQKSLQSHLNKLHAAREEEKSSQVMDWHAYFQPHMQFSSQKATSTPPPWYCNEPFVTIQNAYVEMLEFIVHEGLTVVGVIFFLDAFVVFFTGKFDPMTGELVPAPFFKRWISGVLLQLLLNPRMIEVSAAVKAFMRYCFIDVGPVTFGRWVAALFLPLLRYLMKWFERNVWRRLVIKQNARICTPLSSGQCRTAGSTM